MTRLEMLVVGLYGLSSAEVAQGYILTCQAVPLGEGVVLDYDA